jgi:hypothetical protein
LASNQTVFLLIIGPYYGRAEKVWCLDLSISSQKKLKMAQKHELKIVGKK